MRIPTKEEFFEFANRFDMFTEWKTRLVDAIACLGILMFGVIVVCSLVALVGKVTDLYGLFILEWVNQNILSGIFK